MKRWAQAQPDKAKGPDGVIRPIDNEHKLNEMFALTFADKGPQQCLDHLRSLSTRRAMKPPFDQLELAHLEGARWLMSIIESRIILGRNGEPRLRPVEDKHE